MSKFGREDGDLLVIYFEEIHQTAPESHLLVQQKADEREENHAQGGEELSKQS